MDVPREEPQSDECLIQAAIRGDDEAFASLASRYQERVLRMASRFTRDPHELQDLCQEVFLQLYRKLRHYDHRAPFEHWLARITTRRCIDHLRRNKRQLDHLRFGIPAEPPQTPRPRYTPTEARDLLEFALAQLAPENRAVITLLELEDRPVREIASLLGWSESKVKVRALRTRRALATILKDECDET